MNLRIVKIGLADARRRASKRAVRNRESSEKNTQTTFRKTVPKNNRGLALKAALEHRTFLAPTHSEVVAHHPRDT